MRLISKLFILCNFIALQPCLADCPFIIDNFQSSSTPGHPYFLTLPAQTIRVDADTPAGASIGKISINGSGHNDVYYDCRNQTVYTYGKILNTSGLIPLANNTFAVGDTGVSIKPSVILQGREGVFPSSPGTIPTSGTYVVFPNITEFSVELYKIGAQLNLHNPLGDIIIPATSDFIHQWINSDTPGSNRPITVNIGAISIVSTPVCKIDSSVKDVPFGSVTETSLNNGIKRNLDFALQCQTDFGTFNAIASINASKRTQDNKYITVTDSAGNTDRLKIGITDSQDKTMNVDGSSSESKNNIYNNNSAQFNWSATLLRASPTSLLPAVGNFTAQAEITFQIN
ncbi:Fimbrial protein [Rosenbergiella nectarea]|uniref:Fimbrial protein n=1 Tax=Rosenbergiella nectarea TaxID=988801 RepID=A0A1H9M9G8_9GAMM|nr:fimbrial protein [Rosenbergiella nectarea]SER20221.1 Fimbrial protein [Rosenbergiella nectarea]